jgi:aspartate kinase
VVVVKKFGGTSVGSIERIKHVASLLLQGNQKLCVVVSAMAGETDRLLKLASAITAEPEAREVDALLATGEQVTASLLAMELISRGVKARSFDGSQAKISTDGIHRQAKITDIETSELLASIDRGEIPIVTGFQGVDVKGDTTTLGRGGSDISAVALAAALKAQECHIYTDVEGVYSADPRIVPNAKLLNRISHEEMLELASLGAKVLHPRSVYFAMAYRVPLVVRSTFVEGEGTWIVPEEELMEKPIVSGITYRTDETKIRIARVPGGIESIKRIFVTLAERGIFVDMISQTGTSEGRTSISFTVLDEQGKEALKIVEDAARELGASEVAVDTDIAKVSVVGVGMRYHTGVAADLFSVLAREGIEVSMISTSEIKVSILVPRKYCELAVRALHDAFSVDVSVEK